jgi:hypothetical protein
MGVGEPFASDEYMYGADVPGAEESQIRRHVKP